MKKIKISKTKHSSWKCGKLAKGCRLCVKGQKLVLYVTGICGKNCYFCPLSEKRKNKDLTWANEMLVKKKSDAITEARLCDAKGAGITGGDPLLRLKRTVSYIKTLKKTFGDDFHIHLYTPLENVTEKNLKILHKAGLDEIRFHPELRDQRLWDKIKIAGKLSWDVGVEIPVIPGDEKEIKNLIKTISTEIDFINLNELEISDTNRDAFRKKGFIQKNKVSYGVKGSEQLAKRILRYCSQIGLSAHYCTTTLKDKEQLGSRLKRRAKSIACGYDIITDEGLLYRGAIESSSDDLISLRKRLMRRYDIPKYLIGTDREQRRLLIASWILIEIADDVHSKYHELILSLVEEYPTCDLLKTDVRYI